MANKQTDPVYTLAEQIVGAVQQITQVKTDKAAFDKSYSATILGVNRSFTDAVDSEDQTDIIKKYSIPETITEGEQNYYTFKINGAYYCKRQNGDFMLYEPVMVYIPNGEWSRMYIDRVGSGGDSNEGSNVDIPDIIKAVDAPGGEDPLNGDLWFYTTSESITEFTSITEDTFNGLYEYATDEDTQITQWTEAEYVIAPEAAQVPIVDHDGVLWIRTAEDSENFERIYVSQVSGTTVSWKQVYPDSETGYTPTITVSSKKPMRIGDLWLQIDDEDSQNLIAVYLYDINPETNKTEWIFQCRIKTSAGGVGEDLGHRNENFNTYTGHQWANRIIDEQLEFSDCCHLEGESNTLRNCDYTSVGGANNAGTYDSYSIVHGNHNTFSGGGHIIAGAFNNVSGSGNTVAGYGNTITGESNVVAGGFHKVGASGALVCGYGVDATGAAASYVFYAGNYYISVAMTSGGYVYATSYNTIGADYAEYFEWADGNPENEDRRGMLVSLSGDKIQPADGDDIDGIISVNPSVCGNDYQINWKGKYKTDVFGEIEYDEIGKPILSDEYDKDREYIPRSQRKEWARVGLIGQLTIIDNGSCEVGKYVSAQHGIGCITNKKTKIKCLERIDRNHVRVLIK